MRRLPLVDCCNCCQLFFKETLGQFADFFVAKKKWFKSNRDLSQILTKCLLLLSLTLNKHSVVTTNCNPNPKKWDISKASLYFGDWVVSDISPYTFVSVKTSVRTHLLACLFKRVAQCPTAVFLSTWFSSACRRCSMFWVDWGRFPRMRLFQPNAHHVLSSLYRKPFSLRLYSFFFFFLLWFGSDGWECVSLPQGSEHCAWPRYTRG